MIRAFTRHARLTSYSFDGFEWHYLAGALAVATVASNYWWFA